MENFAERIPTKEKFNTHIRIMGRGIIISTDVSHTWKIIGKK